MFDSIPSRLNKLPTTPHWWLLDNEPLSVNEYHPSMCDWIVQISPQARAVYDIFHGSSDPPFTTLTTRRDWIQKAFLRYTQGDDEPIRKCIQWWGGNHGSQLFLKPLFLNQSFWNHLALRFFRNDNKNRRGWLWKEFLERMDFEFAMKHFYIWVDNEEFFKVFYTRFQSQLKLLNMNILSLKQQLIVVSVLKNSPNGRKDVKLVSFMILFFTHKVRSFLKSKWKMLHWMNYVWGFSKQ